MIVINAQQGSAEWAAARTKTLNASEAPAMMGASKNCTRTELLRIKKTGITPDTSEWVQRFLFDKGHEIEAAVRRIVEKEIGEELYPIAATDDDGRLLASSDGTTMLGDTGMECKMWNEKTAAAVREGRVPDYHAWQLDQQIHVLGLEKVIFVVSDGTAEKMVSCEYRTTPERIAQLLAGWEQFERDLEAFEPNPEAVKPVGVAPEALPALRIEVTGMVTASNLSPFRDHAMSVLGAIKTDLQTDADFADAEQTVKWCREVEDRLEGAKQHALSQTASIDELFRTIDAIKAETRAKRLELDKLVKAEKENRKAEIVRAAHQAFSDHLAALLQRTGVPIPATNSFGDAIKGLKSLDSMRDKVSTALANAKIEANAIADRIDTNRKMVDDMSLVPDFAQVATKSPEDFAALIVLRKQQRADAEAKRLEAEREKIRAEEKARLIAEAEAQREAQLQQRIPAPIMPPVDTGAKLTIYEINQRLSPITLSADGLAQIGIQSTGKNGNAALYLESDFSRICESLVKHVIAVSKMAL